MLVLDSHVHIHPDYELATFLDAAARNMTRIAASRGDPGTTQVLFLTESHESDVFEELQRSAETSQPTNGSKWTFRVADEIALTASDGHGAELFLVAGRQVVSTDDLEVLAVGTRKPFSDRTENLQDTIASVLETGAIAILPWGAGKWWSRRGRLIVDALESSQSDRLFLGDSGGRPVGSPSPLPFNVAASRGIRVLRGSDPLPFRREQTRAGRFGNCVQIDLDVSRPTVDLLRALRDPAIRIDACGHAEAWHRFLLNQCAMQLRKRRRRC